MTDLHSTENRRAAVYAAHGVTFEFYRDWRGAEVHGVRHYGCLVKNCRTLRGARQVAAHLVSEELALAAWRMKGGTR